MSKLAESLSAGKFTLTAELIPPKGTNLRPLLNNAEMLKDKVRAFNITDSHTARMTMTPLAVGRLLLDRGVEPILQLTCRDRNRIALQSDLLGASALGISNLLCMTGDDPSIGDHRDAKPVFDLDAITLLKAIASLQSGRDLAGNKIRGTPEFLVGAVVNPGAPNLDLELRRMEQKIEAGAQFFQTQAVYEPEAFGKFMNAASAYKVPILASIIVLKSGDMARFLNANVPGILVPEQIVQELDDAPEPAEKSVEVTARLIKQLRPMCQGIHLIAAGWESRIVQALVAAGI